MTPFRLAIIIAATFVGLIALSGFARSQEVLACKPISVEITASQDPSLGLKVQHNVLDDPKELRALDAYIHKITENALALNSTTTAIHFFSIENGFGLIHEVDEKGCILHSEMTDANFYDTVKDIVKKALDGTSV